ncbi:MAG: T9SS C-terminal target domain-containing protein, partial [Parabacteroides sp.]|nr:T9SS C-terminal target domain-containing protein [Parabacteroides sp.]
MKRIILLSLLSVLLSNTVYSLQAQVSNPSSWESFVHSTENILLNDTFRLQTFGKSTKDNWNFTLNGSASVVQDKNTLKIPLGSSVTFDPFSLTSYSDVKIAIHIGGLNLSTNDSLLFDVYREQANVRL